MQLKNQMAGQAGSANVLPAACIRLTAAHRRSLINQHRSCSAHLQFSFRKMCNIHLDFWLLIQMPNRHQQALQIRHPIYLTFLSYIVYISSKVHQNYLGILPASEKHRSPQTTASLTGMCWPTNEGIRTYYKGLSRGWMG